MSRSNEWHPAGVTSKVTDINGTTVFFSVSSLFNCYTDKNENVYILFIHTFKLFVFFSFLSLAEKLNKMERLKQVSLS